jgi:hypothetical protein
MSTWHDFVGELAKLEFARAARKQAVDDWGSDIPATLLFSTLGKAIANRLRVLTAEEKAAVFCLIEKGMQSDDSALRTLVATGLLESLASQIVKDAELETLTNTLLGAESRRYLIASLERWAVVIQRQQRVLAKSTPTGMQSPDSL